MSCQAPRWRWTAYMGAASGCQAVPEASRAACMSLSAVSEPPACVSTEAADGEATCALKGRMTLRNKTSAIGPVRSGVERRVYMHLSRKHTQRVERERRLDAKGRRAGGTRWTMTTIGS